MTDTAAPDQQRRLSALLGVEAPGEWLPFAGELADRASGAPPWFLADDYVVGVCGELDIEPADAAELRRAASAVRSDAAASALSWLWHRALFPTEPHSPATPSPRLRTGEWPMPPDPPGAEGLMDGMFPLLILLSGYRDAQSVYARLSLPPDVVRQALGGVPSCLAAHRERTGRRGLGLMYLNWLLLAFRGRLYRLGVLNFEIAWLGHDVHVLRHRRDGGVAILAGAGAAFDATGLMVGPSAPTSGDGWTARFLDDGVAVAGHSFDASGRARPAPRVFGWADWDHVLGQGDPVLGVHIPRQGRLTVESCRESMSEAERFFRQYFPDHRFGGFTCSSWMLDPRLAELLPSESNILRFQGLFHLYSTTPGPTAVYWFVFRGPVRPVEELPEDTTLQRRLKDYLRAGHQLGGGGGVILTEPPDLE